MEQQILAFVLPGGAAARALHGSTIISSLRHVLAEIFTNNDRVRVWVRGDAFFLARGQRRATCTSQR